MKKLFFFTIVILLSAFQLNAQALLLEENFDYPAGDTLTTHGWNVTGTSTFNTVVVANPGLTYTGYPSSGIGNAASLTATGQDINKAFLNPVTSGSVYASALVQIIDAKATGDYFLHLGVSPTNSSSFFARTFVRLATNGNLSFGLSKTSISATNTAVWSDSIYSAGTTYLIVIKYTFNDGSTTDDEAALFINPALSSVQPAPDLTRVTTQTDAVELGVVNLRQGSSSSAPNLILDGIRVSTSWDQVIPVELTSFAANANNNSVTLKWTTASETNNSGFEIQRSAVSGQNSEWEKIGFVKGSGNSTSNKNYSYTDNDLAAGKYSYRLKQIDYNGQFEYSNIAEVDVNAPLQFSLGQNYPNPFNPATTINFSIPETQFVTLKIFNVLGQELKTLVNGIKEAGVHKINFDASSLNSGLYFYKLEAGSFNAVKKMMLTK